MKQRPSRRPERAKGDLPSNKARAAAPAPVPPPRKKPAPAPQERFGVIGYIVHAVAFLLLAGAAYAYFGRDFAFLSAGIAAVALISLRDAWDRFTGHHDEDET